jgi:hypothetical protein
MLGKLHVDVATPKLLEHTRTQSSFRVSNLIYVHPLDVPCDTASRGRNYCRSHDLTTPALVPSEPTPTIWTQRWPEVES